MRVSIAGSGAAEQVESTEHEKKKQGHGQVEMACFSTKLQRSRRDVVSSGEEW